MRRLLSFLVLMCILLPLVYSAEELPPAITQSTVGKTIIDGTLVTITSKSSDIDQTVDGFRYFYRTAAGDFDISARLLSMDSWSAYGVPKAGLMYRESLEDDTKHVFWGASTDGLVMKSRIYDEGAASAFTLPGTVPHYFRLTRIGNTVTSYHSTDGQTWETFHSLSPALSENIYVGLAVTSDNDDEFFTASFDEVYVKGSDWRQDDYFTPGQVIEAEDGSLEMPMVLGVWQPPECTATAELCSNGIDDDCDGFMDCDDSDCDASPSCAPGCLASTEICDNGADEDCDDLVDCADSDCSADAACYADPSSTTLIDDPLQGSTDGQQAGGTLTSEGFRPGKGTDHILYELGELTGDGYLEFEMKGFDFSKLKVPTASDTSNVDHGFAVMYDGRGIGDPISWDNFRDNYFRWNLHYIGEKYESTYGNRYKSVLNLAAPTQMRLTSSVALFKEDIDGDGDVDIDDRDWYEEPGGDRLTFDPDQWYTFRAEWNEKQYTVSVDGVEVWHVEGPYDYRPKDFKVRIGSGPGKYDSELEEVMYRNVKLVVGPDSDICTPQTESCSNGVDDDCDGQIDCADSDCSTASYCQQTEGNGFIKIDPAYPHSFIYENGARYFPFGDTAYYLLSNPDSVIEAYIDSRAENGFNFIRVTSLGGDFWPFTSSTPSVSNIDESEMQKLDRLFDYAASKDVNIELLMWGYDAAGGNGMWGDEDREKDWVRYLAERYADRENLLMWTVTNEFERYDDGNYRYDDPQDDKWANEMAGEIKRWDDNHLVGVHAKAGLDEDYTLDADHARLVTWPLWEGRTNIDLYNVFSRQGHLKGKWTWCPTGNKGVNLSDTVYEGRTYTAEWVDDSRWRYEAPGLEDGIAEDWSKGKPVINTEMGYQWERDLDSSIHGVETCQFYHIDTTRKNAWKTVTSGGFIATGFAPTANVKQGINPNNIGKWRPEPFVYLYDFMTTKTEYWKMEPKLDMVASHNSMIGRDGQEYVAYFPQGGSDTIDLPSGSYTVSWLNPRTGAYAAAGTISGGSRTFTPPSDTSMDWVLHLHQS